MKSATVVPDIEERGPLASSLEGPLSSSYQRPATSSDTSSESDYVHVDGDGTTTLEHQQKSQTTTTATETTAKTNQKSPGDESHLRSILKGISWRIVASMTTVVIAWLVTGEVGVAFAIGSIEVFAKILIYYLHERVWLRINV